MIIKLIDSSPGRENKQFQDLQSSPEFQDFCLATSELRTVRSPELRRSWLTFPIWYHDTSWWPEPGGLGDFRPSRQSVILAEYISHVMSTRLCTLWLRNVDRDTLWERARRPCRQYEAAQGRQIWHRRFGVGYKSVIRARCRLTYFRSISAADIHFGVLKAKGTTHGGTSYYSKIF